jgi:hypothetical protein
MPKNYTLFATAADEPLTQKQYLYIVNYQFNNPQEDLFFGIHSLKQKNWYTHLLSYAGIPVDFLGGLKIKPIIIDESTILDSDLLKYPFHNSIEFMSRGVTADTTLLDLGCGDKSLSKQFPTGKITTLDSYEKFSPDIFHNLNAPLPFKNDSYDLAILLDVIEHLEKERGFQLLEEIKKVIKSRFFVLTPLHWQENDVETNNPNSPYYHNNYNLHHSLWTPEDFKDFTRVFNPIMVDYFFGYWEKK